MICLRLGNLAKVNAIVPSVVKGWEDVSRMGSMKLNYYLNYFYYSAKRPWCKTLNRKYSEVNLCWNIAQQLSKKNETIWSKVYGHTEHFITAFHADFWMWHGGLCSILHWCWARRPGVCSAFPVLPKGLQWDWGPGLVLCAFKSSIFLWTSSWMGSCTASAYNDNHVLTRLWQKLKEGT